MKPADTQEEQGAQQTNDTSVLDGFGNFLAKCLIVALGLGLGAVVGLVIGLSAGLIDFAC